MSRNIRRGTRRGKKKKTDIPSNEWRLYERNLMDFYSNDNFLEVLDKHNNVVFQLSFEKPNIINLHGYSVNDDNNQILIF